MNKAVFVIPRCIYDDTRVVKFVIFKVCLVLRLARVFAVLPVSVGCR